MADKLQLQVILSALDKASAPLKRMQGGSIGAAKALKETRDRLKQLNATQSDVSAWRTQRAAADQTQQALGAAQERVKALSRTITANGGPTRAMAKDMRAAVREATQLKQQAGQQQTALQGLRNKLTAAGISTRNLSQADRDLKTKIGATNQALRQQEERLKRVTTQQRRLAAARSQYERTQALAGNMASTGAGGLATGSAMLYAGARIMAPGLDFDASMSNVQALTRLDKESAELAALRAQARELGSSTQFTAGQAAEAQGFLAMAGYDPQAIQAAMPGMLDLAKAGKTELAETADIASNILTGFKLAASETGRLGDVLVGTFTRSNLDLQMLGDTMKYAAPGAAALSQDIETVAAMAGKLGDAGIQGSMGGTALRAILSRLAAPPKAAAEALEELGISAADAQGNMREMPDILAEIFEKTKSMGNTKRLGLLKGIGGEEAGAALQVLVDQAGSGALQEFVKTLKQTEGEASRVAKVMADNLKGDLSALGSAWEDLGIQVFEQQDGPFRDVVKSLTEVVGAVKAWIVENPELAAAIVKTAAGIAILMAGMGGLTLMLGSILGPFAMVRYGMALFGIKGAGLATVLVKLGKFALPLVGKALLFIGRALMANPIGLAVALIAGAVYLIYKNWEPIKAYFLKLWAEIKAGFGGGLGGILTLIADFSPIGLFYRAFAGVMNYLGFEMPEKFSEFGMGIINSLIGSINTALDGGFAGVAALIINWSPLGLFYQALAPVLSYFGVEMPAKFTDFGSMLLDGLINGIKSRLGAVKETITGLGDSTIGWFKDKLGIHSPSRVFAGLGGFTMAGLAQGLAGGERDVLAQIGATAKRVIDAGSNALGGGISFDTRAPIAAAGGGMVVQGDTITISIQATPGTDTNGLRQMLNQLLDERERGKAARMRARLSDRD